MEPQAAVPLLVCTEELQNYLSCHIRGLQDVHGSALEQSRLNLGETIDFNNCAPSHHESFR